MRKSMINCVFARLDMEIESSSRGKRKSYEVESKRFRG